MTEIYQVKIANHERIDFVLGEMYGFIDIYGGSICGKLTEVLGWVVNGVRDDKLTIETDGSKNKIKASTIQSVYTLTLVSKHDQQIKNLDVAKEE